MNGAQGPVTAPNARRRAFCAAAARENPAPFPPMRHFTAEAVWKLSSPTPQAAYPNAIDTDVFAR